MKVELSGKRTASVQILLDEGIPPQFDGDHGNVRRTTVVKISVRGGRGSKKIVEGVAFCNPCDRFNSLVGRRTAMRKAFDKSKNLLSKSDRRAIAEKVVAEVF